jgi:hypothetical protein
VDIADATEPIRPGTIDGDVSMKLAGGRAWGMDLTSADIDASLRNGLADIRMLEITGSAAKVSAKGPLALEGAGESALTYQAAIGDLSAFEALAGRPMKGSVELEGTITGPAQNTASAGKFASNSLDVAGVKALRPTARSTQRPRSRLRPRRGQVIGGASFIEVGDVQIASTTMTLNYDGTRLDVEALLEQPQRAFKITGALVPHPDHHEVHIASLTMTAGATEWQTPAGRTRLRATPRPSSTSRAWSSCVTTPGYGSTAQLARLEHQRRSSCAWSGCKSKTWRRYCSQRRN